MRCRSPSPTSATGRARRRRSRRRRAGARSRRRRSRWSSPRPARSCRCWRRDAYHRGHWRERAVRAYGKMFADCERAPVTPRHEARHQLDVRRPAELRHRPQPLEPVATFDAESQHRARRCWDCMIPRRPGARCSRASSVAWAAAPARGGSKTTASKRASSGGVSGRRNRSRCSTWTWRRCCGGGAPAAGRRWLAPSTARTRAPAAASGRAKVPSPANRSATRSAPARRRQHRATERRLALARRLKEGGGRQRDGDAAEAEHGRTRLDDGLDPLRPFDRQSGEVVRGGEGGQPLDLGQRRAGDVGQQQVEAAVAVGQRHARPLPVAEHCREQVAQRGDQGEQVGRQHPALAACRRCGGWHRR